MRANGFTVNTHDVGNKEARERAGISTTLGSCHTALVDGYAIEGHVPAQDIKRLLRERPRAIGLTAPGMPHGSPGMEGARSDPYDVLLINKQGETTVYSRHLPSDPQRIHDEIEMISVNPLGDGQRTGIGKWPLQPRLGILRYETHWMVQP